MASNGQEDRSDERRGQEGAGNFQFNGVSGPPVAQVLQGMMNLIQQAGLTSGNGNIPLRPTPSVAEGRDEGTSPFRLSQLRALTSPYPPVQFPRAMSGASGSRSSRNQSPGLLRNAPVLMRVFTLTGPDWEWTPTVPERQMLQDIGFGEKMVTFGGNASGGEVGSGIKELFPLITGDFELMRANRGGPRIPLMRISDNPVPGLLEMRRINRKLDMIIYVRPLTYCSEVRFEEVGQRSRLSSSNPATTTGAFRRAASATVTSGDVQGDSEDGVDRMDVEQDVYLSPIDNIPDFLAYIAVSQIGKPTQVEVFRRNFMMDDMVQLYSKRKNVDFKGKFRFEFRGESGVDAGGLTREFFRLGWHTISEERYNFCPLVEGEKDHLFPTNYHYLVSMDIYEAMGRFMAHSFINTGLAAVGLSQAMVEYIFSDHGFLTSYEVKDIMIPEKRAVAEMLQQWTRRPEDNLSSEQYLVLVEFAKRNQFHEGVTVDNRSKLMKVLLDGEEGNEDIMPLIANWKLKNNENFVESLTEEQISAIRTALQDSGYYGTVDFKERHKMYQVLMDATVIYPRESALAQIRQGFKEGGVYDFLKARPHLWNEAFRSTVSLEFSAAEIHSRIELVGSTEEKRSDLAANVFTFLESLDGVKRKKFIECFTGSSVLPERNMKFVFEDDAMGIHISTCEFKCTLAPEVEIQDVLDYFMEQLDATAFNAA